jgi:hypothetical protein
MKKKEEDAADSVEGADVEKVGAEAFLQSR